MVVKLTSCPIDHSLHEGRYDSEAEVLNFGEGAETSKYLHPLNLVIHKRST